LDKAQTGADWFLLVRVPEITAQRESGVETMKVRLGEWLDALSKAGFHPMRLSDIVRRLERGDLLPPRTVAFFFNPGYRRTYEIASPIFEKHNCPAAILTNEAALKISNRRYLSYHALRDISVNHGWDSGFSDNAGAFSMEGMPGLTAAKWSASAGALALNRRSPGAPFNFLTANADWLAGEFVNRLLVEAPVSEKATLSKASIHGRDWGVARDNWDEDSAFDMQVVQGNKGLKLFWLGTSGVNNFRLHVKVKSLFGELWLQLRYDEASGDNVHLILSGHDLLVEDEHGHQVKRLGLLANDKSFSNGPFTVDVTADGGQLSVSVDGKEPKVISGLETLSPGKGVVQIYLVDKVRGTAKIQGLRLLFESLPAGDAGRIKPGK
jgi:hypothetical protein